MKMCKRITFVSGQKLHNKLVIVENNAEKLNRNGRPTGMKAMLKNMALMSNSVRGSLLGPDRTNQERKTEEYDRADKRKQR